MTQEFVFASGNSGKLRELTAILKPLGLTVRPQSDWQVPEADETACTFIENALIKARQAAAYTGLPCIADDSGLVVPALGGEPGIYSSRYAGQGAGDEANISKLLSEMAGKQGEDRQAYFFCAMVLVQSESDPAPLLATGRWHGCILLSVQGHGGFGYDPLFGVPDLSENGRQFSAAEMLPADKNLVSHRGLALQDLVRQLRERDEGITE